VSKINWPIVALGVTWWYVETQFFGWNRKPESIAELFADGMVLAFFAAAFAFKQKQPSVTVVVKKEPGNG